MSEANSWGEIGSEENARAMLKDQLDKSRGAIDKIEAVVEDGNWNKAAIALSNLAAALLMQRNAADMAAKIKAEQN